MANPVLAILPAAAFLLLFRLLQRRLPSRSWREAFLAAAVALGVFTGLVTEALSLFHFIAFPAVASLWLLLIFVATALLLRSPKPQSPAPPTTAGSEKLSIAARLLLGGLAFYVLMLAFIALIAPPDTWDSLEYHMPKVMHWAQNQSVAFYPTSIPRQNHLAPGSEFAILHLQVLSGTDRFANLVEWFCMVGSLVAVSLIARELGASRLGQVLAAVFAGTFPMAILQAASTQTDFVVAFWFICFVYFTLRLGRVGEAERWPLLLAVSAALGLAVLCKATAYLFAFPFVVWLGLSRLRARRLRALPEFAAITAVFLLLNAGHYSRNASLYGNPLGPGEEPSENSTYTLASHTPAAVLSSISKHIGTHINTPWRPINEAIGNAYVALHEKIGWELGDTRTSFGPAWARFRVRRPNFHDECDGNPVHLLLAVACGAFVVALPGLRRRPGLLKYTGALAASALLMPLVLKWHPWMSRLHVAVFVAAAPMVGAVLAPAGRRVLPVAVGAVLLLLGLPWLFLCQQRPLIGERTVFNTPREQVYFFDRHQSYEPAFFAGRDYLLARDVSRIGLVTGNSSWEYPWWVLLGEEIPDVQMRHVIVTNNPSAELLEGPPFSDFQPEALLSLDQDPQPETLAVGPASYSRTWSQDAVGIYLRD